MFKNHLLLPSSLATKSSFHGCTLWKIHCIVLLTITTNLFMYIWVTHCSTELFCRSNTLYTYYLFLIPFIFCVHITSLSAVAKLLQHMYLILFISLFFEQHNKLCTSLLDCTFKLYVTVFIVSSIKNVSRVFKEYEAGYFVSLDLIQLFDVGCPMW